MFFFFFVVVVIAHPLKGSLTIRADLVATTRPRWPSPSAKLVPSASPPRTARHRRSRRNIRAAPTRRTTRRLIFRRGPSPKRFLTVNNNGSIVRRIGRAPFARRRELHLGLADRTCSSPVFVFFFRVVVVVVVFLFRYFHSSTWYSSFERSVRPRRLRHRPSGPRSLAARADSSKRRAHRRRHGISLPPKVFDLKHSTFPPNQRSPDKNIPRNIAPRSVTGAFNWGGGRGLNIVCRVIGLNKKEFRTTTTFLDVFPIYVYSDFIF